MTNVKVMVYYYQPGIVYLISCNFVDVNLTSHVFRFYFWWFYGLCRRLCKLGWPTALADNNFLQCFPNGSQPVTSAF